MSRIMDKKRTYMESKATSKERICSLQIQSSRPDVLLLNLPIAQTELTFVQIRDREQPAHNTLNHLETVWRHHQRTPVSSHCCHRYIKKYPLLRHRCSWHSSLLPCETIKHGPFRNFWPRRPTYSRFQFLWRTGASGAPPPKIDRISINRRCRL